MKIKMVLATLILALGLTQPALAQPATDPVMTPVATDPAAAPVQLRFKRANDKAAAPVATTPAVAPVATAPVAAPVATAPVAAPVATAPVPVKPVVTAAAPVVAPATDSAVAPVVVPATKVYVELETSSGDIVLELNSVAAPLTVANFVQYVRDGHYTDTIFHRVIRDFMIQGGGMDAKMKAKPTRPPIKNEADNGLKNVKYSVAMARTGDPNSATAQFFISTNNNVALDFTGPNDAGWGYAVFGKVVKGQKVVDTIAKVKTGTLRRFTDVPGKTVTIKKAMILDGPPK